MNVGLTKHTFDVSPFTASSAACCAITFPAKYPSLKNSGNQFSLHASTSDPTDTYATRCNLPPRFALPKAATFASPFPCNRASTSVPITPTQETTASGLPTILSNTDESS